MLNVRDHCAVQRLIEILVLYHHIHKFKTVLNDYATTYQTIACVYNFIEKQSRKSQVIWNA